ncbi:MAG TPA: formimidoylglutamate deiminase [Usitatibacter sp.]|jgi:formimidoylglutamate deiminase|nr:formimidoylglutamate deiminase [Usitatibacter sp.]
MRLHAAAALLPDGWAEDVAIELDGEGRIAGVTPRAARESGGERIEGFVVPGMPNVHSHAFQRAMAGLTELRTDSGDSFWTWRDLMYRFAGRITPDQVHDIAAWAYVEMLKGGYTAVGEFHYLHHDTSGRPYADPAEMSHRIAEAALATGIALTHLPVLYQFSGFGARPPTTAQARFIHSTEGFMRLVEGLHRHYRGHRDVRVGLAFHSLRAVDPGAIAESLAALKAIDPAAPVHIHVAEQRREVDDCVAWSGERPVQWLLGHARPDVRWCLVHATHLEPDEARALAASGAVAGLCPTTEANLGDGIFPARDYFCAPVPGRIGIGSDSHVEISVAAELRMLEYSQRLSLERRSVLASGRQPSPAARLYTDAALGGARALAIDGGRIAQGCRADLVVLDREHPALWNKSPAQALDAWTFAGDASCVRDVMVAGAWRVRERHHPREAELSRRYRAAQAALLG